MMDDNKRGGHGTNGCGCGGGGNKCCDESERKRCCETVEHESGADENASASGKRDVRLGSQKMRCAGGDD